MEMTAQEKVDAAIEKIRRLRKYRDELAHGKVCGAKPSFVSDEQIKRMVNLLDSIEQTSTGVIHAA